MPEVYPARFDFGVEVVEEFEGFFFDEHPAAALVLFQHLVDCFSADVVLVFGKVLALYEAIAGSEDELVVIIE